VARATRLAFFGTSRGERVAHESGWTMTGPLIVLGVGAVLLGLAGSSIAGALGAEREALNLGLAALAVVLAGIGAAGGWVIAADGGAWERALTGGAAAAWNAARSGYGFDGLVTAAVIRPAAWLARATDAMADRMALDGIAEGAASLARRVGDGLAALQTGDVQWYASLLAAGVVLLLAATVWLVK
jgi:NADH-quinone oxidoreductase subunit L